MTTPILYNPDAAEGAIINTLPAEAGAAAAVATPAEDWRSSLPEDIRTAPTLEKFKSPADVVKSYINLEKKLGERPQSPERASSPEAYTAKVDLAEGMELDKGALDSFRALMHEKGLPADVGSELVTKYFEFENGRYAASKQAQEQARASGMTELGSKWGEATQHNIEQALKFVQTKFPEAAIAELNQSGMGNSPALIEALYELSKNFQEDTTTSPGTNSKGFEFKDAKSAIDAFKSDKTRVDILYNNRHPEHKAVKDEWNSLHDKLTGKVF